MDGTGLGFQEVIFSINCPYTLWGDHVAVCGSCEELGSWNPWKGLELRTSAEMFPKWHGRVQVPRGHHEFKLVIVRPCSVEWEGNPNRPCVANVPMEVLAEFHNPETKAVSLAPKPEECDLSSEEMPWLLGRRRGPGFQVQATTEALQAKDKLVSSVEATAVLKIQRWWKQQVVEEAATFEDLVEVFRGLRSEAAAQIQKMWRRKCETSLSPAAIEDEIFFG